MLKAEFHFVLNLVCSKRYLRRGRVESRIRATLFHTLRKLYWQIGKDRVSWRAEGETKEYLKERSFTLTTDTNKAQFFKLILYLWGSKKACMVPSADGHIR